MIVRSLLLLVVAFASFLGAIPSAEAVSVSPPIMEFRVDPGDRIEDRIRVFNEDGSDRLRLVLEAVNFTHKEGDETSGAPQFYPGDETRTGRELASWLRLPEEEIEVAPLVRRNIDIAIEVPPDAGPGSYFGAAILRTPDDSGRGVGLVTGTAVLMIVRVNGDAQEEAVLTDFDAGAAFHDGLPIHFAARVENHGNVHLQPHGAIRVTDLFGRQVAVLELNRELRSVLPGSARRYEAVWGAGGEGGLLARQWRSLTLGRFTAEAELEYGSEGKTLTASRTFWVIPWLALLVLFGGLIVLALAVRAYFRWYARRVISRFNEQAGQ